MDPACLLNNDAGSSEALVFRLAISRVSYSDAFEADEDF
jgi:hypothetical protein